MPCRQWFDAQDAGYRYRVPPRSVRARLSAEAGVAMPWRDLVDHTGESVSLEHFGASAPYRVLYEQFGITAESVVAAAWRSLDGHGRRRPWTRPSDPATEPRASQERTNHDRPTR
jgi:transketolase